jgi:hypothetical protein
METSRTLYERFCVSFPLPLEFLYPRFNIMQVLYEPPVSPIEQVKERTISTLFGA